MEMEVNITRHRKNGHYSLTMQHFSKVVIWTKLLILLAKQIKRGAAAGLMRTEQKILSNISTASYLCTTKKWEKQQ
jgi:hypothetical protein